MATFGSGWVPQPVPPPPVPVCPLHPVGVAARGAGMALFLPPGAGEQRDGCHPAFAHPGTHPQAMFVQEHGFRESAYEMRVLPPGLVVFAPPTAAEDEPIPEQAQVVLRFELPDR